MRSTTQGEGPQFWPDFCRALPWPLCSASLSIVLCVGGALCVGEATALGQESQWACYGSAGRLVYTPDAEGDRIPDFSGVGYGAGQVPIPDVPTVITLNPADGDDTTRIQAAIDAVAAMPMGPDGFRGAVQLGSGHYDVFGQIRLDASGIVLRGEGREADGTVLHARGTDQRPLIAIEGSGSRQYSGSSVGVINKTVPVGMRSFDVTSASGFQVGDTVLVTRPSTGQWIYDIGIHLLNNPWTAGSKDQKWERTITRIEGNRVFLDKPLTNSLSQQYGGGFMRKCSYPGRIQNVGVERLRGESDFVSPTDEEHSWTFTWIDKAENVWVRQTEAQYFGSHHVDIDRDAKWVTVEDAINRDPVSQISGGRRNTFSFTGQQSLVTNCQAQDGRHDFTVDSTVAGPNVFHNSIARSAHSASGPHHRWSTGTLFDNITVEGDDLNARNRGNWGTGHGWAGANTVIWNSMAEDFKVQNPPTAQNWLIGSVGQIVEDTTWGPQPSGTYDSHGTPVSPQSLYEAQTADVATLREYRWAGGEGNWNDVLAWDQRATPAVREIQVFDYLIGDIDSFEYDGPTSVDEPYIDPAWKDYISNLTGLPVGGFDTMAAGRSVAFTQQYRLDPGQQVVHATLALALRPQDTGGEDDGLRIDQVGEFSFSDLQWAVTPEETTVGVLDLGDHLPALQHGQLSVQIGDDTASDFALLSLSVATEVSDADGAAALIGNGGRVTVDTEVPTAGWVIVAGPDSRLTLETGGDLQVIHDVIIGDIFGDGLPGSLALSGGRILSNTMQFEDAAVLSVILDDLTMFDKIDPPIETSELLLAGILELSATEGLDLQPGDEYPLFAYDTRGGDFDSIIPPPGLKHLDFTLAFNDTEGSGVLKIGVIPEPSTIALFGAGAIALTLFAWRRKAVKRSAVGRLSAEIQRAIIDVVAGAR